MDFKAFVESADEESAETAKNAAKTGVSGAQDSADAADAPSMWSTIGAVSVIDSPTRPVARKRPVHPQLRDENSAAADDSNAKFSEQSSVLFPVGWLVVIQGPGRGTCLTLQKGVSRIDYTDANSFTLATAASERSLATIVYDAEKNIFYIGDPGDVYPTKPLDDGDILNIGKSEMRFVALCNAAFDWTSETEIAQ